MMTQGTMSHGILLQEMPVGTQRPHWRRRQMRGDRTRLQRQSWQRQALMAPDRVSKTCQISNSCPRRTATMHWGLSR